MSRFMIGLPTSRDRRATTRGWFWAHITPDWLDVAPIVFTDADLHRSNIVMSRDLNGMPKVTARIELALV
jgi:hypothetical protein